MQRWPRGFSTSTQSSSANNTERFSPAMSKARWNNLTKPPGSLGRLEEIVDQYESIRGGEMPAMPRKGMYIFCGDHGVTAEGVSAFPSEITGMMVRNFLRGGAAVNGPFPQKRIEAAHVGWGGEAGCGAGT